MAAEPRPLHLDAVPLAAEWNQAGAADPGDAGPRASAVVRRGASAAAAGVAEAGPRLGVPVLRIAGPSSPSTADASGTRNAAWPHGGNQETDLFNDEPPEAWRGPARWRRVRSAF